MPSLAGKMTGLTGEHLFRSPGGSWQLWILAGAAVMGIAFGLILRSTGMMLFFVICWLVPILALIVWRRTFVKTMLSLPERGWRVMTYSGATHTFQKEDVLRGHVTRLGRLVYYIVESRSNGKLRFVITDDTQERFLSSL